MPADAPHLSLCKSVMSSVALGYPLPILLNWKGEFNRPEWHLAGSHIAKLESLHAAIEALLADPNDIAHDDDLAVLVDSYDIWFQLPPSVLIQRYHQLNKEADQRIRKEWRETWGEHDNFPIPPPKQNIVVTSAKDCHPGPQSGSNPHYDHWPQSPMPKYMYGPGTDKVSGPLFDSARQYKKMRPRCVNSGMIMGTMGALRAALVRSKEKIAEAERTGRQLWSDQALFGEIMGDQELWREWMRHLGSTWNGDVSDSTLSGLHKDVVPVARAAMQGKNFEFGIGLDYSFSTIPPTCSAEEDGYFVNLNDHKQVEAESEKAGVVDGIRVRGVPPELALASASPNGARDAARYRDPLRDISWGDVPLYTDFYFGTTPVGIHHNAYVDNLKAWRVEHWWERMWFYPQLRKLVSSHLILPQTGSGVRPIVRLSSVASDGKEVIYMPPASETHEKVVTVFEPAKHGDDATFPPISWDGICQKGKKPWFEELFGDKIGPLAL